MRILTLFLSSALLMYGLYNRFINQEKIEVLLKENKISFQTHFATTEDGYILKLFRMKNPLITNNRTALFVHGLLDSSDSFLIGDKNVSIAVSLYEKGYDIWLGNSRGNKHSKSHVSMNPDSDSAFWNYSYHEMGIYDLPAMINYIRKHNGNNKITYFGHSQGGQQFFSGSSLLPEFFKENINGVVALGPVTKITKIKSETLSLFLKSRYLMLLDMFGDREIFSANPGIERIILGKFCADQYKLCEIPFRFISDNSTNIDSKSVVHLINNFPSGTSIKNIKHMAQNYFSKQFKPYDNSYDSFYNNKKNSAEYDLSKIQNDVCLFAGVEDLLASIEDNRVLKNQLEKIQKLVRYVEIENIGHLGLLIPSNNSYFEDIYYCLDVFNKNK